MDAAVQSFEAIFRRDVRYLIPVFQRRYQWTREDQLEPLWQDVLEVLAEHQAASGTPNKRVASHFLGAIVVRLVPFPTGSLELREIIDGQQRLTTVQLLISAARRVAVTKGFAAQAEMLADLLYNRPYLTGDDPNATFKVWPTKHDRVAFSAAVGKNAETEVEDGRVADAYRFFHSTIGEWADGFDGSALEAQFVSLEVVLRTLLKIVWIDLEDDDNPQVIFETLNDRGAPLNAIDLVKNLVFQRQEGSEDLEDLYESHWSWIEDDWWQETVKLGRLDRVRADVFLGHWLQMELMREVNSDHLFKRFRRMLEEETGPNSTDLIPVFAQDAGTYRSFYNQPPGSSEARFFSRVEALNTTTPFPLLLYLFRQPPDALAPARRRRALVLIEDYLMRRMLWRGTTQGYNRLFSADLLKVVKANVGRADEVLFEELADLDGDTRWWPRDDSLRVVLTTTRAYGSGAIARHRLIDVLWEVEVNLLRTEKSEPIPRPPKLTVEHVMPQNWRQNWPLDLADGGTPEVARIERDASIHKLGNVTLVTDRLNPSLSNSAWAKKRVGLHDHSLLRINKLLLDGYPEAFDEAAIEERGLELASHILAVWPGPEGGLPDLIQDG